MIRIKTAIRYMLDTMSHMFQHTDEPYPSRWERAYLCSTAPISAEAMRDEHPNRV